jgi:putative NADPH-quinone reductase
MQQGLCTSGWEGAAYQVASVRRITIVDGHPDPNPARFCHALADAYAESATAAGHDVQRLKVADLDLPILRTRADWEGQQPPSSIRTCQQTIAFADHIVIIYPLWLGDVPALLKAFFEQVFRPGFAIRAGMQSLSPGLLKGKSARVIVTMSMPALIYRWFFRGHTLKSLRRNILYFVGIKPVYETVIGSVEGSAADRAKWLDRVKLLAQRGS